MKLILVNTIGPMGCACTCSIIEHFGYVNLPNRKRGLTDYVLGKRDILNDNFFKERTIEILEDGSKEKRIGGTSVFERELNLPKRLYDLNIIKNDLKKFEKKKYDNIRDAYYDSVNLFNNATIYKNKIKNVKGSIEQILDIHQTFRVDIYEKYKIVFKDITFINIDRDFNSWFAAICGQNFMRKKLRFKDFKISVINYYILYLKHINFFKYLNGLNLKFNEIFIPNTKNYANNICEHLKEDTSILSILDKLKFDSYGHIYNYVDQFTYMDKNLVFITENSFKIIDLIKKYYNKNKFLTLVFNIIFQFFYIFSFFKFRKKNNKVVYNKIKKKDFYEKLK